MGTSSEGEEAFRRHFKSPARGLWGEADLPLMQRIADQLKVKLTVLGRAGEKFQPQPQEDDGWWDDIPDGQLWIEFDPRENESLGEFWAQVSAAANPAARGSGGEEDIG